MAWVSTKDLLEVIWACHLSMRRTVDDVGSAVTVELRCETVTSWATQLRSCTKGNSESKS